MSELKFHPFFWLVVVRSHPPTISPSLTLAWLRWYTSGAFWAIPSPWKNQFINWGSIIGRFTTFLNPWSDQLKTAFQLSIRVAVHMETPCPDSRRGPSGTVSWSGLFRTVSRQDKMCQNPTVRYTELSNQWGVCSETCVAAPTAGHKPHLRLQLNGTSGTHLGVKLSLPEI